MPNNQAKIKFNAAYMARLDRSVQVTEKLFKKIQPKLRPGREADKNRVVSQLWTIKQYAYCNTSSIPFSDERTIIKHNEESVRKIRNSKQSLKVLYATLLPARQKDFKSGYAAALDLFNQFETVITEIVLAKG